MIATGLQQLTNNNIRQKLTSRSHHLLRFEVDNTRMHLNPKLVLNQSTGQNKTIIDGAI